MTGVVKSVVQGKNFGFIRDGKGVEYFFHRESFEGHWDDLVYDVNSDQRIEVEFEPKETPKGKRAESVGRKDWPNTAR